MSSATLPLARLEAVFLDAGNTLMGMDVELIAGLLGERGVTASPDSIARAEAAARPAVSRLLAAGASSESRDTFGYYVRRTLDGLAADDGPATAGRRDPAVGLDALADEIAHRLKTEVRTRRLWSRVLPGVPEALASLRAAGLKLVVVSNSDGTIAEGLREQGLAAALDGVVDSAVVGVEKPDPRIFRHALAISGSDPARTAHVGDLYAVDVVGARAAGLHGVLLDPFGDWDGVDCARATDLAELARRILAARA